MILDIPNEIETQWLISQGVSDEALFQTPCLRAGNVRFLDNGTFEFADDGHLTISQRAMIAAELTNMSRGNFSKSASLPVSPISQPEAAKLLNVGIDKDAKLRLKRKSRDAKLRVYRSDADGIRAIIFRVVECGTQVDLVAWSQKLNRLATWRGSAFALGQEAIFNPGTYFMGGALKVHRSPLDWLKGDRDGICIVQPRFAYSQLGHVERLLFSDKVYGAKVKRWLQPPEPRAKFLVEIEQVVA